MTTLFRWDRCDPHLPWARVARHRLAVGDASQSHTHDFAEWCWVESGGLLHDSARGRETLERGDLRLLRPGDQHGLAAIGGDCILITASVPGPFFAELERRYRDTTSWPWAARGIAAMHLDDARLSALAVLVAGVPQGGQERCDAEWLVAGLLRCLRGGQSQGAIPDWLEQAVARFGEPRRLAAGLPGLIRLCGRSPAHVSRAVRRAYACTATELVHRLRCQHAASELRLGTRPIATIAADCGYIHLGHFYRRFGAIFGCAPRAYRQAALGG